MRLRFGELSVAESEARERLRFSARLLWSLVAAGQDERARSALSEIDERLALAIEPSARDGVRSVELELLSPSAWPLAELLLRQAPVDFGDLLALGRGATELSRALDEARSTHGVELSRSTLRAGFGRGHLLELTLGVPGGVGSEIEQNAAENLVRRVLGERVFETWIGAVHATPAARVGSLRVLDVRAPRAELSLSDLFDTVAAAVRGVLLGLPDAPHSRLRAARPSMSPGHLSELGSAGAEADDWTMLEVEPLADAQALRKEDLMLASTCTPELLRCFLDGAPCSSRRFSRMSEQFVFLSYVDDLPTMKQRVQRRSRFEAVAAHCLAGVGAVTGVGLGVHATYLDFALNEVDAGLERLVSALRAAEMPEHSFIQFFDTELTEEWLSIWPDARLTAG
jgi:hypothetical protein